MPRTVLVVHDGHGPIRGSERVLLTLFDGIDPTRYRFAVTRRAPCGWCGPNTPF
ncbi:MAG TPA: hypothetical protein VK726_01640 [Acetobacteraceae bacterium]|jgi:hypothetical protein|nr:hypothetical protein [Acetobacteraceae bacterium]